ncbi:MAG: hypothetical protein AAGD05_15510, partial [Bacteroidota bacterium]
SLPIEGRNPVADCQNDYFITHSGCDRQEGKGLLHWVDGTVHLGYYIAMLTLECHNLRESGQAEVLATSQQELLWALMTVERLDSTAEIVLGFPAQLDGFFMRDDVASDFYLKENAQRRFAKADGTQFDCVKSACSCSKKTYNKGALMSQDQVLALLFGFSFVHALLDEVELPPTYQDTTKTTYGDFAALLTHRIIHYLRESKWRIRNPDGTKISNKWGGDVRAFNNAIARIGNRICGQTYRKSYHRGSSRVLGWAINGIMNWGFGLQAKRNKSMILESVVGSGAWNSRKMAKRSLKSDKVMYALAYAVVNQQPLHKKIKRSTIEELLNTAPIDGPCFGTPGCTAPDGWKSSDRWWHSKLKNGNPYGAHFEYSGIDYMLLYNLYYVLYQEDLGLPPYQKQQ